MPSARDPRRHGEGPKPIARRYLNRYRLRYQVGGACLPALRIRFRLTGAAALRRLGTWKRWPASRFRPAPWLEGSPLGSRRAGSPEPPVGTDQPEVQHRLRDLRPPARLEGGAAARAGRCRRRGGASSTAAALGPRPARVAWAGRAHRVVSGQRCPGDFGTGSRSGRRSVHAAMRDLVHARLLRRAGMAPPER